MKPLSVLAIALSAAVSMGGCYSTQSLKADREDSQSGKSMPVDIATGITLLLPQTPNYPGTYRALQTLIGKYENRSQALQAVLEMDRQQVKVVLMLANGPRAMEVNWTREDIIETRSRLTPDGLSGLHILADIFLVYWPKDAIAKALPQNVFVNDVDGARIVYDTQNQIISINYIAGGENGRDHVVVTNYDRGYALTIYSERSADNE